MSLVDLAEPVPKLVQISKTKQVEILGGQVMVDNTQLARLWNKDRKTVPKLLDAMEAVGIFSSQEVEDNRIYTFHCLSGWYVDAKFVSNDFSLRRDTEGNAIVHKDVPASKVIITENRNDILQFLILLKNFLNSSGYLEMFLTYNSGIQNS